MFFHPVFPVDFFDFPLGFGILCRKVIVADLVFVVREVFPNLFSEIRTVAVDSIGRNDLGKIDVVDFFQRFDASRYERVHIGYGVFGVVDVMHRHHADEPDVAFGEDVDGSVSEIRSEKSRIGRADRLDFIPGKGLRVGIHSVLIDEEYPSRNDDVEVHFEVDHRSDEFAHERELGEDADDVEGGPNSGGKFRDERDVHHVENDDPDEEEKIRLNLVEKPSERMVAFGQPVLKKMEVADGMPLGIGFPKMGDVGNSRKGRVGEVYRNESDKNVGDVVPFEMLP